MVNAIPGYKNPVGASVYGSIAGNAWYRAQYLLQDQKLGHYMHVPPKTVFFSQIFGSLVGVPINYAVIRWVLDKKGDYLLAETRDPTNQWTGQTLTLQLTIATQYVLIVCATPPFILYHLFGVLFLCCTENRSLIATSRAPNASSPMQSTDLSPTDSCSAPSSPYVSTLSTVSSPAQNSASTSGTALSSSAHCPPSGATYPPATYPASSVVSSSCIGRIDIIMRSGRGIIIFLRRRLIAGII